MAVVGKLDSVISHKFYFDTDVVEGIEAKDVFYYVNVMLRVVNRIALDEETVAYVLKFTKDLAVHHIIGCDRMKLDYGTGEADVLLVK